MSETIVKSICQHCQRVTVVPQETLRQLLSEADKREELARERAIEECAQVCRDFAAANATQAGEYSKSRAEAATALETNIRTHKSEARDVELPYHCDVCTVPGYGDASCPPLCDRDASDEITLLRAQLAAVLEDRARFPDKPDMIGSMISAHYGNLKAKAENAEEHCRRLRLETAVAIQDAKRQSLEQAAGTHQARVTEIRNDPASYKNGTITKSAKRASDFHERSAQVILALQGGEQ